MTRQKRHVPLTAAALSLLLAACGGGDGGSSSAVSASPDSSAAARASAGSSASAGTTVAGNTSGPASQPGTPPATNPPSAGTQPNPAPAPRGEDDAPAGAVTPVSDKGIRGDVLLSMLEQQPCKNSSFTPARGPDGSFHAQPQTPMFAVNRLGNYANKPNWYGPNTIGCNGQDYAPVKAGSHTYRFGNGYYGRFNGPPHKEWRSISLAIPVTVTDQDVTLGKDIKFHGYIADPSGSFDRDLGANAEFRVAYTAQVPYGSIIEWRNGAEFSQMTIEKGTNANDVRLCFNTDTAQIKQTQCLTWNVPADWAPLQSKLQDVDQTLVQDRSVMNLPGFSYWN